MSTNAGNDDSTIGGPVGERTTISPQTKAYKKHQKKEIAGNGVDKPLSLAQTLILPTTSMITVIGDPTKTKEEPQTKNKPTSSHSNPDLTPTHGNKSGGVQPPKAQLKRFTTVFTNFNLGNRRQQSRDNDSNGLSEDVAKPAKDNSISAMDPQAKLDEGGTIPEQHRATVLSQNLAAEHSVPTEQSADPLSMMTKVRDKTRQQRDQDLDDFFNSIDHVQTESFQSPELEKVWTQEEALASLEKLVDEMDAQSYRNNQGSLIETGELANGEFPISLQTKSNQEYQKKKTPSEGAHNPRFQGVANLEDADTTAGVDDNGKEELQTITKLTSTHSNTDLTQVHGNKSGGAQTSKSPLKRLTTVFKNFNLGNRHRLQGLDYVLDLTGQFECTDELVVGGFWRAYKGRWIEMAMNAVQPPIAVKVINLPPLIERQQNKQFKHIKHGLKLWSKINHKNILPLLGIAYINAAANIPAFVSPWMENGNAKQFRLRNPSFPPLLILYDIIQGLHYLHTYEPQIVHGDIRAINVLINDRNEARLCEFSQVLVDGSLWRTTATQAGGSLRWMSPELMTGEECTPTKESDIYAFAMTCYEILSGDIPFKSVTREITVLYNVLLKGQRPERVESCDSDYMWDIITRCWAKKPEDRPRTTEVLELLHPKVNLLALPSRDFGP